MPVAISALRNVAAGGDADAAVVVIGALPLFGDENVVGGGIVDHARDHLAFALQPDRDGEDRQAMQEIGGAVERIDVPDVALVGALDRSAFLHHEAIARPRLGQFLEDRALGLAVGDGDEIARPLDRNLQVLDLAEIALQAAPGLEGGGGHHIHQCGIDHGAFRGWSRRRRESETKFWLGVPWPARASSRDRRATGRSEEPVGVGALVTALHQSQ